MEEETIEFRKARANDFEFAWGIYSAAVQPHVGPTLARGWIEEDERRRFATIWNPKATSVFTTGNESVGWLSYAETDTEIVLEQFFVAEKFRRRGVGTRALQVLIEQLAKAKKPIVGAILKGNPSQKFFESCGFQAVAEQTLVVMHRRHKESNAGGTTKKGGKRAGK